MLETYLNPGLPAFPLVKRAMDDQLGALRAPRPAHPPGSSP